MAAVANEEPRFGEFTVVGRREKARIMLARVVPSVEQTVSRER